MVAKRQHPTTAMPTETEVLILGHWSSKGGIQMDQERSSKRGIQMDQEMSRCIVDWEVPKNERAAFNNFISNKPLVA